MMNRVEKQLPFGIPRDLLILAVGMMFWGLGEGLFIFFYPLSIQRWNTDTVQIGAILSYLGVLMALVQIPAGRLSDRFGSLPLVKAGFMLGVIAAVVMAFAKSLPLFLVGLSAYTLTSFIGAPINSYITVMRGDWKPQRAMTFISGAAQVGGILGPMLGGWIGQKAGFNAIFMCSAVFFLISTALIFLTRKPATNLTIEQQSGKTTPIKNPRFLLLCAIVLITIFALSMPQQLTSLYLQEVHHLSVQQIGMTGTVAGIGATLIMFTLGNLNAPLGMVLGQVFLILFSLFMWRGESVLVFYGGYLFVGGYRYYRSMAMAEARPMVKAADVGLAYGMLETCNALAVIFAPLAAGLLYRGNPHWVYIAALSLLVIMIVLTFVITRKLK